MFHWHRAVSYTHLDVYKRQERERERVCAYLYSIYYNIKLPCKHCILILLCTFHWTPLCSVAEVNKTLFYNARKYCVCLFIYSVVTFNCHQFFYIVIQICIILKYFIYTYYVLHRHLLQGLNKKWFVSVPSR